MRCARVTVFNKNEDRANVSFVRSSFLLIRNQMVGSLIQRQFDLIIVCFGGGLTLADGQFFIDISLG